MNRPGLAVAAIALLAMPAAAQSVPAPGGDGAVGRGTLRSHANPSAVIAAELALDRDSTARGPGPALAAAAAPAAVVFTPALAWAARLKGQGTPVPGRAQTHAVWSSCDGSLVASRGIWRAPDGRAGWFARIWERQGDGRYKWLAGLSGALAQSEAEPEMIVAGVADCPQRQPRMDAGGNGAASRKPPKPPKPSDLPPLDPRRHGGASADGSLRWEASVAPYGVQRLVVSWRKDGADQALLDERVAAAG